MCASSLADQLSLSALGASDYARTKEGVDFCLELVSLTDCNSFPWEFIPSGGGQLARLFFYDQQCSRVEFGIAAVAVWRDVDVLVGLRTTG